MTTKCHACAVPLTHGAHTFESDGKQWHCACLIRSLQGEVSVLRERYEALRPHVSDRSVLRGLCGFAGVAEHEGMHDHDDDARAALDWLRQTAGWKSVEDIERERKLQRDTLAAILSRVPSVRTPAVGISSDGVLQASWSFVDVPGLVFTLSIPPDGRIEWFYRDAATDIVRGSGDPVSTLPDEAIDLLAAAF